MRAILFFLLMLILALLGLFAPMARADTYLSASVAKVECPRQSNTDQVECDASDTLSFSAGGGWIKEVGAFEAWYGGKFLHQKGDLHGENDGPEWEKSADGRSITLYGLQAHGSLALPVYGPLSVFVAVEPGICLVRAFGDNEVTGCASGQAGVRITYGNAFLSAGYGAFATLPTKHDGFRSEYWDHGPQVGLGFWF